MFEWVRSLFAADPMAEFLTLMRKEPWLYDTYSATIMLSDPKRHKGTALEPPFSDSKFREDFLPPIFMTLLAIAKAEDRLLAFRQWLHEIVVAYANYYVLCAVPDQKRQVGEHPGVVGVADHIATARCLHSFPDHPPAAPGICLHCPVTDSALQVV